MNDAIERDKIEKALKKALWYGVSSTLDDLCNEALEALSALEAEKPAEDAKRCAVIAWRSNEHPGGLDWIDSAALVIQQYAESYHARECAKCGKS